MRPNRKLFLSISGGVAIIASLTLWWNHVPEPKLNGVGLCHYLDNAANQADIVRIVPQFGETAVPYLAKQIEPDPIRELVRRASLNVGFEPTVLQKDWSDHQQRRARAISFLYLVGPDAIEAALPSILIVAERPEDPLFLRALPFLGLALGTEYELRALQALIAAIKFHEQPLRRPFVRRYAYDVLPKFKNHPDIIMPPLIESLHEPGGYKRIDVVVRFGTNAIPALREAALLETNHVRPATVALEKILAASTVAPPANVK